ncbi:MAG: penicillin-binding protein activator LpoB [Burkholderiaceae bacterium]
MHQHPRAGAPATIEAGASWALLPVLNHTETPQAGLRAEAILESIVRTRGVRRLARYPAGLNTESLFDPVDRKSLDAALAWAGKKGHRYGLTGSVEEWRYKVGVDGEPAVGLSLQLIDIHTREVVWSAVGSKTGWSREALSAVAQKLLGEMTRPLSTALAAGQRAAR